MKNELLQEKIPLLHGYQLNQEESVFATAKVVKNKNKIPNCFKQEACAKCVEFDGEDALSPINEHINYRSTQKTHEGNNAIQTRIRTDRHRNGRIQTPIRNYEEEVSSQQRKSEQAPPRNVTPADVTPTHHQNDTQSPNRFIGTTSNSTTTPNSG